MKFYFYLISRNDWESLPVGKEAFNLLFLNVLIHVFFVKLTTCILPVNKFIGKDFAIMLFYGGLIGLLAFLSLAF